MEKGEVAILAIQFGALILVVLFLSGFATIKNSESTPKFGSVYWGNQPGGGVSLAAGSNTMVTTNATTISVFYNLAYSTSVGSFSAGRLCVNPNANDTGGSMLYTKITIGFDTNMKPAENYLYFSTTGQHAGWICTYTIGLTDSLQQSVTWVGMVELKPATTGTTTTTTTSAATSTTTTSAATSTSTTTSATTTSHQYQVS